MCSVLLNLFSSYNLAAILGVKFLDKLELVVDYRSTCHVLDLIWIAISCSIKIYCIKNIIIFNQIENGTKCLLKI